LEAAMPTRNVVITDRQAKLIDTLVSSGHYQNASEVLRDGLRLIEERAAEHKAKLKALRDAVQVGIDDMEAGRYQTFASFEEMETFLREITEEVIAEAAE
jgi:antitoxin ParD1/3/4